MSEQHTLDQQSSEPIQLDATNLGTNNNTVPEDATTLASANPRNAQGDTEDSNGKEESISGSQTETWDFDDPFAIFPSLSLTMSSTHGPFSRRNTVTTLGRPLTRQETTQTLKSVRSRFTAVRSEFDENVCLLSNMADYELTSRMIFLNSPRLTKTWSPLMAPRIR